MKNGNENDYRLLEKIWCSKCNLFISITPKSILNKYVTLSPNKNQVYHVARSVMKECNKIYANQSRSSSRKSAVAQTAIP